MAAAPWKDSASQLIDIVGKATGSAYFDEAIGHIEDIVLSEQFLTLQNHFLELHWHNFEDTEENKLEYTDIFHDYTNTFDCFFQEELSRRMLNFDMERFSKELDEHNAFRDTLNYSEIFELLHSLTNFETFKQLMLDYRAEKEGNLQHLDFDILITKPIYNKGLSTTTTTTGASQEEETHAIADMCVQHNAMEVELGDIE